MRACLLVACSSPTAIVSPSATDAPVVESQTVKPRGESLVDSGAVPAEVDGPKLSTDEADSEPLEGREANIAAQVLPLEEEPLEVFFNALLKMGTDGEGKVRVLHYGDSHTAADVFTTAVRRGLQARFGDAGRGFLLMGRPWNSYRPKDIVHVPAGKWTPERILVALDPAKMDGYYGLGGISVVGGAGASTRFTTVPGTAQGSRASMFEVYYLNRPNGGKFNVYVDGVRKGQVDTASNRMRTGFFKVTVPLKAHQFEVRANGEPVRFFGAVVENDGPGLVYDTLGINGGFFYTSDRWNAEELHVQMKRRDPRLLITMYGSNEADSKSLTPEMYKARVKAAMARFMEGTSEASCLMIGPPDRVLRTYSRGDQLTWIIEIQREVATENGCGFIDLRAMMGGPGSHEIWQSQNPPLAQPDGVHMSIRGYRVLGEAVAAELLSAFDRYSSQRRPH